MKRSEINTALQNAQRVFAEHKFYLPEWAFWSLEDWKNKGPECEEIKKCALGWDITDFGSNNFKQTGLLLFTIRNGKYQSRKFKKPYAEKIMLVEKDQTTPLHFHWLKTEDIINRGGGKLQIQLWRAFRNEKLSSRNFPVSLDGIRKNICAGETVILNPGESITLEPYVYHTFHAVDHTAMVGEISTVNNDDNDNRFYESEYRYPHIEEDQKPLYLLCNEYFLYTSVFS